jgi:hypothetical protein
MTIASPRCCLKTSRIEAVELVGDQNDHRALPPIRFLEGDRDAVLIPVAFHDVVLQVEGVQEPLGIGGGGVLVDAVACIAAIADHQDDRDVEPFEPAADGIARFHHAGILDQDDRLLPAGPEPGRDRAGMPFAADPDQPKIGIAFHQQVEPVGFAVGQPYDVGDAVLLHLFMHSLGAEHIRRCVAHRTSSFMKSL